MTVGGEAKGFLEGPTFKNLSKTACDLGLSDPTTIENLKNEA